MTRGRTKQVFLTTASSLCGVTKYFESFGHHSGRSISIVEGTKHISTHFIADYCLFFVSLLPEKRMIKFIILFFVDLKRYEFLHYYSTYILVYEYKKRFSKSIFSVVNIQFLTRFLQTLICEGEWKE